MFGLAFGLVVMILPVATMLNFFEFRARWIS